MKQFLYHVYVFLFIWSVLLLPLSVSFAADTIRKQLDYEAALVDETLARNGTLYQDLPLQTYIKRVLHRVFPARARRMRLRLINSTRLNAYALPNGTLYITTGFLARLDNEAQLAIVLAHEGIHYIREHGLHQRMKLKTAFSLRGTLKYSRRLELEADRLAFSYVEKAGYRMSVATSVFRRLAREKLKSRSSVKRSGYYPKLLQRHKYYQSMLAKKRHDDGDTGDVRYIRKTRKLRILDLRTRLARGDYTTTWTVLFADNALRRFGRHLYYYRAEYYRYRQNAGDNRKLYAACQQSLKAAPGFAPAWRLLGEWYLKQSRYVDARRYFKRYLGLSASKRYRRYIHYYLRLIRQKTGSG